MPPDLSFMAICRPYLAPHAYASRRGSEVWIVSDKRTQRK